MSITHLQLLQTTSAIEVVASSLIDKLYTVAQLVDGTSVVQGNLQVVHAYTDSVDYLLNKFPGLQINVTGSAYIRFVDSEVQRICMLYWGDGVGVTTANVANVPTLPVDFKGNTRIVHFDELKYFTKFVQLDNYLFQGSVKLESVNLVNIKYVGYNCFQDCTSLTSLGELTSVTSIGANAFNGCTKLTSINFSSVTSIGANAFNGCTSLTSVGDSNLLTSIGANAFNGCTNLVSLNISGVTKINDYSFQNCTNLVSVGDTSNVISIGNAAFSGCSSLTSVNLSKVNYVYYRAFSGCSSLTSIDLSKVTWMDSGSLFSGCSHLLTVIFPEKGTFSLSSNTLENCKSLIWIKVLYTAVAGLSSNSFYNTNNTFKIYVPDSLVDAYKVATNWSAYASRIFSLTQFAIDFPNG